MSSWDIRRGEDAWNARLTASQAREIRERRQRGETLQSLAIEYGVAVNTIKRVCDGRTYGDLTC